MDTCCLHEETPAKYNRLRPLLIILLFTFCAGIVTANNQLTEGQLLHHATGQPIAGAQVTIDWAGATETPIDRQDPVLTGAQGHFSVYEPMPQDTPFRLMFNDERHGMFFTPPLAKSPETPLILRSPERTGRLHGAVATDAQGTPARGGSVVICSRPTDEFPQRTIQTIEVDANGEFVSPPLAPGDYRAWFQTAIPVDLSKSPVMDFTILPETDGSLNPQNRIQLQASLPGWIDFEFPPDAQGAVQLSLGVNNGLAKQVFPLQLQPQHRLNCVWRCYVQKPGRYVLSARLESGHFGFVAVDYPGSGAGQNPKCTVPMELHAGQLQGSIKTADGQTTQGLVSVTIDFDTLNQYRMPRDFTIKLTTDLLGQWQLNHLPPGDYTVYSQLASNDYAESQDQFNLGSGESKSIQFRSGEIVPLAMRGTIVDASEQPVAGASIYAAEIYSQGRIFAQTTTDPQGAWHIDLSQPRPYSFERNIPVIAHHPELGLYLDKNTFYVNPDMNKRPVKPWKLKPFKPVLVKLVSADPADTAALEQTVWSINQYSGWPPALQAQLNVYRRLSPLVYRFETFYPESDMHLLLKHPGWRLKREQWFDGQQALTGRITSKQLQEAGELIYEVTMERQPSAVPAPDGPAVWLKVVDCRTSQPLEGLSCKISERPENESPFRAIPSSAAGYTLPNGLCRLGLRPSGPFNIFFEQLWISSATAGKFSPAPDFGFVDFDGELQTSPEEPLLIRALPVNSWYNASISLADAFDKPVLATVTMLYDDIPFEFVPRALPSDSQELTLPPISIPYLDDQPHLIRFLINGQPSGRLKLDNQNSSNKVFSLAPSQDALNLQFDPKNRHASIDVILLDYAGWNQKETPKP